jgi:hypothetical protein
LGKEDKKIQSQIKNKKREQRRQRAKETDQFDSLLSKYKKAKFTGDGDE